MVIDRSSSYSGAHNPNRARYTDYHKNDSRGKKVKEFGKSYHTHAEWKELNRNSRVEKSRHVDYYSFQSNRSKFSQSANIKAQSKFSKMNKSLGDKSVSTIGQRDPYSHLYEKKIITHDSGNIKFKKSVEEVYRDEKRDIFDSKSGFNEGVNLIPSLKQDHFLNIKQQAEATLNAKIKGDISSLMLNNIKAGSKRSSIETLEFIPAKKQSVYGNQDELKSKYIVLRAENFDLKSQQSKSKIDENSTSSNSNGSNDLKVDIQSTLNGSLKVTSPKQNGRAELAPVSKVPVPAVIIANELPEFFCYWSNETKSKRIHSTGLYNSGNTCFLNATIQVLTHTPALFNYLVDKKNKNGQGHGHGNQGHGHGYHCHGHHGHFGKKSFYGGFNQHNSFSSTGQYSMQDALTQHFIYIRNVLKNTGAYTTQTKALSPKKILEGLQIVTNNRMHIGRQEDAHEYLRYVLDAIQRSMLQEAKKTNVIANKINKECLHVKSTTVLHRIFGGYSRSRITCSACKNVSDCFEPFLDLQLDLKNCSHLDDCLLNFTKKELLCGENAYKCSRCKATRDATKQMTIEKTPQILTLQLKRFDGFGPIGGGKISRHISYPAVLDLSKAVSKELGCLKMKYELYGVLVHSGHSCNSGHYYSFCKSPQGNWFCFNDASVNAVKFNQALQQSEAYLLFYNRIEQSFSCGDPYTSKRSLSSPSLSSQSLDHVNKINNKSNGSVFKNNLHLKTDRKETILQKEERLARELLEKRDAKAVDNSKNNVSKSSNECNIGDKDEDLSNGSFIGPLPPPPKKTEPTGPTGSGSSIKISKYNPKELSQHVKDPTSPSIKDAIISGPFLKSSNSTAKQAPEDTEQPTSETPKSTKEIYYEKLKALQSNKKLSLVERKLEISKLKLEYHKVFEVKRETLEIKEKVEKAVEPVRQKNKEQKASTQNTSEKKHIQTQIKSTFTNKSNSLALLADYEDSSTDDSGSQNSTRSSSSTSKREQFLKRKRDRLEKLGDIEGDNQDQDNVEANSCKKESTKPTAPASMPKTQAALPTKSNSSFFKLNVKTWDNQESSIDKQVSHDLKRQKSSSLEKFDLEYDQERIEKADRRFDKREKKKAENREREDREKASGPNSLESKNKNSNKFQEKADRDEKKKTSDW